MKNLQKEILQLIGDYISCAEYLCNVLRDQYPTSDPLLRARRTNFIPKEGKLSEGTYFNFHGGGCYFEFEGGAIDIDFGPNDKCDGFDYYRLHNFLMDTKKSDYKELHNDEILKTEFDKLISAGYISNPQSYPNPHLFYLTNR